MTTFIFELKDTKGIKRKIHIKRKPSGKCDVLINPSTQNKTKKTKTKRVKKGTKQNSNNTLNSLNNS